MSEHFLEKRIVEAIDAGSEMGKRHRRPVEDEKQKSAKNRKCLSTEVKFMERCGGAYDTFFGIEQKLGKEETKEKLKVEPKTEWRCATDTLRITKEEVDPADQEHSS